ncbi:iron ABC transporter permease [Gordonia oryzae]|uniref:Iron ABC transporter permease n=1 Tax=Gordonia oryzae TaxID=2487349 RepID=A0A3N4GTB7_9ACTN|nr:iron ABC transporter permease [Gordonia oryzae]
MARRGRPLIDPSTETTRGEPSSPGLRRDGRQTRRQHATDPRRIATPALQAIPMVFLGVFFLWPVAALTRRASDVGTAGDSPVALLERTHALHLLWVTLGQAGASTVVAAVVAAPIVWLYARLPGSGSVVLTVMVTVPFVLPTVVVGVAFRALLNGPLAGLGMASGWPAVLAAHAFLNVAVMVRVVGAAWRSLDTRTEEAARVLGATRTRAWWSVVAPQLAPAAGGAAALVFLFCSTSFGVIIILGGGALRTLETEIYTQAIGYFRLPEAVMLSLLQIVVVVAVLLCTRIVAPGGASGAAGARRRPSAITGIGWMPVVLAWAWTVLVLVGPIAVLAIRSVRPTVGGSWTLAGYRALSEPVNGVTPLDTLRYSLLSAILAMVIAVVVGGIAAITLRRSPGVAGVVGNAIAMIPLGISAVTLGFGYLIVLAVLPAEIAGSPLVIPCVQALIAIPVVIRIVIPALESVPEQLRQAAAVLGAGPLRVLGTVDLPLIGRSLCAAGGFAFVMALGEFGATSFLARADTTTLPVLIGSALNRPGATELATAMAASMVLVVVTTVAVLAVEIFRPRSGTLI